MNEFQQQSTLIGATYEEQVFQENPHFQNKIKFKEVGVDADFHFTNDNGILNVIECKAYNQQRTDCIKKAIANAFCIKHEKPDCKFILYLGKKVKPNLSGDKMLKAAIAEGKIDEVVILPYKI